MRKSKYLVLSSFYFDFNNDLSEIKEIKALFENQNILDLFRFDKMKTIIKENQFEFYNFNFLYLPKNIEIMGKYVFLNNQIQLLDLSNYTKLKAIEFRSFEYNQIKQLKLPQNIETIDAYAFKNNQIESLDLSNCINLNIISQCAFEYNQIKQLKLPKNIKEIYSEAFCSNKINVLDLSKYYELKFIGGDAFLDNPLNEIKILDDIYIYYHNKSNIWNTFTKYYNDNNKKAGDYKLENNKWQWYPL